MNKLAIFDIDGTLTDSAAQHQAAFMKALESFGFKGFNADFGSYLHHTDTFIFKTIFEGQRGCAVSKGDLELFEDRLLHFIATATLDAPLKEIAGAKRYLNFLRKHPDVDVVFATGSLLKPAKLKLQQTGIFIEEDLLVSANNMLSRDDIVKMAIDKAKTFYGRSEYAHMVSFGDGQWDYETAERLNIDFVGIASEKLLALKPRQFYPDYRSKGIISAMSKASDVSLDYNFIIHSSNNISKAFSEKEIFDFSSAAAYVKQLPYKRNKDKQDPRIVLKDGFGTCSTKHALLKQLAIENDAEDVQLVLCIFKMNAENTPAIAGVLQENGLEFMLEAHNYLEVEGEIVDCTNAKSGKADFYEDTVSTIAIEPSQINEYKVNFHKEVLHTWLKENPEVKYTLDELFSIREKCIHALSEF